MTDPSPTDPALADRARRVVAELGDVALPGGGDTRGRLSALRDVARHDLSVARLVEPHLDALAILAETGHPAPSAGLIAVWASRSPSPPTLDRSPAGGWTLTGAQPFGSGAPFCDVALVSAVVPDVGEHERGDVLVAVDLPDGRARGTVAVDTSRWRTPAFADTGTAAVEFRGHPVPSEGVIGAPGFYLGRPGFWHGALGPAAVWAGGAEGLVAGADPTRVRGPHQRAGWGELQALVWSMRVLLDAAGDEIDAAPDDVVGAQRRALTVRHLVERQCLQVVDLFGTTFGPRPLAFDSEVVVRVQELQLYVRQVHHREDLEQLGALWNVPG